MAGNAYTAADAFGTANSYFGPNFQFAAVPEPSTWALLGPDAVGAGTVALRRRRAGG